MIDGKIEKLVREFLDKKSNEPGHLFNDRELDNLISEIIDSMDSEIEVMVKDFLSRIIQDSEQNGKS